jgi:hypothetical protein
MKSGPPPVGRSCCHPSPRRSAFSTGNDLGVPPLAPSTHPDEINVPARQWGLCPQNDGQPRLHPIPRPRGARLPPRLLPTGAPSPCAYSLPRRSGWGGIGSIGSRSASLHAASTRPRCAFRNLRLRILIPLNVAIDAGVVLALDLPLRKASAPTLAEHIFYQSGPLVERDLALRREHSQAAIIAVAGALFFRAADLFPSPSAPRLSARICRWWCSTQITPGTSTPPPRSRCVPFWIVHADESPSPHSWSKRRRAAYVAEQLTAPDPRRR